MKKTKIEIMKNKTMKKVYFDESGNTGQNLVDLADPIFVLASCSFNEADLGDIRSIFNLIKTKELKFSKLRKTSAGQTAILKFLKSPFIHSSSASLVVIHKPFMIVTKYCDLVLEPSMFRCGLDFYVRGMNISTSNLLTMVMPVFLGKETWEVFLRSFVDLIRKKTPTLFRSVQLQAKKIYEYLRTTQPKCAYFFAPLLLENPIDSDLLETATQDELDPLIPAYFILADFWGKTLKKRYVIIADESKALTRHREIFLNLSDASLPPETVGYDRRTSDFPFKVDQIITVDSRSDLQIQLADILAGALAYSLKKGRQFESGSFESEIYKICSDKKIILWTVWPNDKITPKDLDTEEPPRPGQISSVDYVAQVLREKKR